MDGKRAVLALMLSVIVACGGSTPAGSAGAGASAAATAGANASGGATSGGGGATTTAATTTNGPKLADLLAAGKLAEYKITYRISASGGGADAFSGDQTWYFKPPRARFDFSMDQGGQKTTISFFSLADGTYYCFGTGGSSQCFGVSGVGSPLDQNFAASAQQSLMQHPDQFGASFTSQRSIAGQQGYCYDVKSAGAAAAAFSAGTFCYSKDGLALLSSFSAGGGNWSMEATNVSTTVPDSDFTLPAKPLGR